MSVESSWEDAAPEGRASEETISGAAVARETGLQASGAARCEKSEAPAGPRIQPRVKVHLGRILPPLAMLVVVLVIVRRLVVGRVMAGGDLQVYFYPYWTQVVRALRRGHLPLWTPYLFGGAPLAANSQVGLFYPLNWPFWLVSADSLPAIARALHLSVIFHLCLAAWSAYHLARRGGLRPWAAAFVGLVYGGSGTLGSHLDHLNQLQALAWMPLLFLSIAQAGPRGTRVIGGARPLLPRPLSVAAMAMILLAGHTQMAFIAAVGVMGGYLVQAVWVLPEVGREDIGTTRPWSRVWRGLMGLLPFALAGFVAGIQLIPTLQLMTLSGRSGGLPWREAVSFSVAPGQLLRALLPTYLVSPALPESVAYIGLSGLLAAGLGVALTGGRRETRRRMLPWLSLAGLGLFLALGAYNPLYLLAVRRRVPGLSHFRAPARFLALFVLGAAVLAGQGLEAVARRAMVRRSGARRLVARGGPPVLTLALIVELVISAEALPQARATAPRAYTDLRPATAHLVAATADADEGGRVPGRFLSISRMLFEVGDKAEIEAIYAGTLSDDALWAYLVAAKQREILAPNLPAAFGVPAVDGYDGGLLPLRRYMTLSELLIPGGTLDGRLRENLSDVPDERWLDLLAVRYLLTDKTGDLWVDDILYDRQFQPVLPPRTKLAVAWMPPGFDATGVSVLYTGGPVTLRVQRADGEAVVQNLPAVAEESATTATAVDWSTPTRVEGLQFEAQGQQVQLRAVSLMDVRDGAFYPLVLSNRFRLAHSGDVKIYEAITPPSRVTLVRHCERAASAAEALRLMADGDFDPRDTIVLEPARGTRGACPIAQVGSPAAADAQVAVVSYEDQRVVVDVETSIGTYLLLKDAIYPGWRVRIEDRDLMGAKAQKVTMFPADVLFRAVPLEAGRWRVTFQYVPTILYVGLGIMLVGMGLLVGYGLGLPRRAFTRLEVLADPER